MILKKYNRRTSKQQEYPKIQSKSNVQKIVEPQKTDVDPIITNQLIKAKPQEDSPKAPTNQQNSDYFNEEPNKTPIIESKPATNKELLGELDSLLTRYSIYFTPADEEKAKKLFTQLKKVI